jgi:hypothetical protein
MHRAVTALVGCSWPTEEEDAMKYPVMPRRRAVTLRRRRGHEDLLLSLVHVKKYREEIVPRREDDAITEEHLHYSRMTTEEVFDGYRQNDHVDNMERVYTFLQTVNAKVATGVYKTAEQSEKFGDDLDRYVLPILRAIVVEYPLIDKAGELLSFIEKYSLIPSANAFQRRICDIVYHLFDIHDTILYLRTEAEHSTKDSVHL